MGRSRFSCLCNSRTPTLVAQEQYKEINKGRGREDSVNSAREERRGGELNWLDRGLSTRMWPRGSRHTSAKSTTRTMRSNASLGNTPAAWQDLVSRSLVRNTHTANYQTCRNGTWFQNYSYQTKGMAGGSRLYQTRWNGTRFQNCTGPVGMLHIFPPLDL